MLLVSSGTKGMAGTAENGHHLEFDPVGLLLGIETLGRACRGMAKRRARAPTTVPATHCAWAQGSLTTRLRRRIIGLVGFGAASFGIAWSSPPSNQQWTSTFVIDDRVEIDLVQVRDVLAGRQLVHNHARNSSWIRHVCVLQRPHDTIRCFGLCWHRIDMPLMMWD